jgi:glycosyltransferase involved in cell wall biosynthesis
MSLSNDITAQLKVLTGGEMSVVIPFLPFYRRATFEGIEACVHAHPFRVLYAGRIVRSKGVFDLLDVARTLQKADRTTIEFDLCGSGRDLDELKSAAASAGVAARFRCLGHCSREQMREFYGRSQIVVAPTKAEFVEGFNKVVAEAILAGRPVITSDTCPALEYVKAGVVEVPPDDVLALEKAILALADDVNLFKNKVNACGTLRELFLDAGTNWASALRRALQLTTQHSSRSRIPATEQRASTDILGNA